MREKAAVAEPCVWLPPHEPQLIQGRIQRPPKMEIPMFVFRTAALAGLACLLPSVASAAFGKTASIASPPGVVMAVDFTDATSRCNAASIELSTSSVSFKPPCAKTLTPLSCHGLCDAVIITYDGAVTRLRDLAAALNGSAPTAQQQGELAAVVQQSGLAVERYNSIAQASAADPAIRARIRVLKAPMPAANTVAAGVTEDELRRYVGAVDKIRDITAEVQNGRANAEQGAALSSAVRGSGLSTDRYNAIAKAVFDDQWLRARANAIRAQPAVHRPQGS